MSVATGRIDDRKQPTITGVVLAGGRGRRMGGNDKGLRTLHGKPLAQWAIERLAPQVDELLINANRNRERYAAFGYPVVADRLSDFAGPLAGLHAALSAATRELVATVPCDAPFFPDDLVARLLARLTDDGAAVELAVARTPERAQPVFCLCRREVLPRLTAYLAGGGRKVAEWHATLKMVEVSFDESAAFVNINTAEDLARCHPPAPFAG
ncbi:MAG TPA: molybdenum cofactor guanylyltransferase MobA [Accumulibacter sp.]|nr:molybdenum cofactor guanylyltransferase MobA [Accumulibacter sp.]